MKSRYEVLTTEAERRGLAVFRSSAAVAVLAGLTVLAAQVGPHSPGASVDEVFAAPSAAAEPAAATPRERGAIDISSPEEVAAPPRHQGEPSVY